MPRLSCCVTPFSSVLLIKIQALSLYGSNYCNIGEAHRGFSCFLQLIVCKKQSALISEVCEECQETNHRMHSCNVCKIMLCLIISPFFFFLLTWRISLNLLAY